jgi:hypothetical protein
MSYLSVVLLPIQGVLFLFLFYSQTMSVHRSWWAEIGSKEMGCGRLECIYLCNERRLYLPGIHYVKLMTKYFFVVLPRNVVESCQNLSSELKYLLFCPMKIL